MFKKRSGSSYEQKREYCDSCLDEVVATGACRNAGCRNIGGTGVVNATFRDQLFYEKKQYTFPPNNCTNCRAAKKEFERRQEVRPTCALCKKSFRVTYGVMIMVLKNEERFGIPRECVICRGLSPDERLRIQRESDLDNMGRQRLHDLRRLLANDKAELARERERHAAARSTRRSELTRLLKGIAKLERVDMRARLHEASRNGSLRDVLDKPGSPKYRAIREMLAHVTGGKGNMTEKEFAALPNALKEILKDHPGAMGLFQKAPKHRAPGMTPVNQHYEILSTAALKVHEAVSSSGKKLRIYSTDRVDFGIKSARNFIQPGRGGTLEADTLIHRSRSFLGLPTSDMTIGIDAKHTEKSHYTRIPWEQMKGIRNGFADGTYDQFFYVTNAKFSDDFKKAVEDTNWQIVRDYVSNHNAAFKDIVHMHRDERAAMPDKMLVESELRELAQDRTAWNAFTERYEINQIEVCEHVQYPGT